MDFTLLSLLASSGAMADGPPGMWAQIGTLIMLIILQAVLGFDNLLYISLESKRAPEKDQARVRRIGIGLAIVLRIVLLFLLVQLISLFQDPVMTTGGEGTGKDFLGTEGAWLSGSFNIHSLIVLLGGVFILYTATKEVLHMMHIEYDLQKETKPKSVASVITWIVLMNLIFSFDSILSAMALAQYTKGGEVHHLMWVMVVAIVVSGILMIWLADKVSAFLQKNRMYEVLGLFILFVVGIMLLTEGAHLGHMSLFGSEIMPMTKATFYFVIAVLVVTDIVQTRYQKKLLAESKPAVH